MRRTERLGVNGIRWPSSGQLGDLDFADDIALLASKKDDMQTKINKLNQEAETTGLKINTGKTKMLKINTEAGQRVTLNDREIEEVESFVYLGATVTTEGGAGEDIRRRIGKVWAAFTKLRMIWESRALQWRTKLNIYKTNVIAVLMYGSETWRMTRRDKEKLDCFLHKSLRRIYRIRWQMRVTNEEIRRRTGLPLISETVTRRRWKWILDRACFENGGECYTENRLDMDTGRT